MKIRGEIYFLIAIILFLLFVLGWSFFEMKFLESKLLPILIGSITLVLAAFELRNELSKAGSTVSTSGGESAGEEGVHKEDARAYVVHGAWAAGLVLGIYVLGFIAAIFLFVLFYMRQLGSKWREAIIFAVVFPAIVYGLFEVALSIDLYRGLLLTWLS